MIDYNYSLKFKLKFDLILGKPKQKCAISNLKIQYWLNKEI